MEPLIKSRARKLLAPIILMLLCTLVFVQSEAFSQTGTIRGTVVDAETREGLIGASVLITGTYLGSSTDRDGRFSIDRVPPGRYTVEARFVGYRTGKKEVTVLAGEVATVSFELRSTALPLDEVVVTGQGREVELRQIGSVLGKIDAGALQQAPVVSLSQLLQSRETGVIVQQGSGAVGQASRVMLRGPISLALGVQPVIYVDGMRIDNSVSTGAWTGSATWQSMDDINWADVERVEIVKGASAATLYGTQAAAGVIQIFTKRARDPRQTAWTYSNMMGYNELPADPVKKVSVYGDWFMQNVVRTGNYQQHNLSAQGVVGAFQYFTSGTYRKNQGPYPNNQEDYYSLRLNLQFLPREDLVMRMNTAYSDRKINFPQDGNNIFSYLVNGLLGGPRGAFTPLDAIPKVEVNLLSKRVQSGLTAEYTPFEFLTARGTVGLDVTHFDNIEHRPYGVLTGTPRGYKLSFRRASDIKTADFAAILTFKITPDITSTTSVGFQGVEEIRNTTWADGTDFPVPGLSTVGAAAIRSGSESRSENREYGFYFQERVGLYNLLFITAGFRADRNTAFGVDFGWGYYPSIGVSYVVSDHDFWPEWLGQFRLRAQYGQAGKPPGIYDAIKVWAPISAVAGAPAVTTSRVGDRGLGPEVSNELEGGFDLSVLQDRVNLEVTYYNQRTTNALLPVRFPPSAGFLDLQNMNAAEVSNQGLEVSLKGRILDLPEVRWGAGVNFSYNKNEILDMQDVPETTVQWSQKNKKGYPVGGYHADRIELGPDGNVFLNPEVYIGPAYPVRTIQISTDVTVLRNLRLNLLVDHQGGHYTESGTFAFLSTRLIGANDPVFPNEANRPVAPWARKIYDERDRLPEADRLNPNKYSDPVMAAYVLGTPFGRPWGNRILKADFWRLREATVSYTIPSSWIHDFGLTNASIYFTGRNLWYSSDALTMDTETNYNTFNEYTQQDFFVAPLTRQYYLGIRVGF
jgi:TonB-dependent SusC/RagA subfamily outer membrane receptor